MYKMVHNIKVGSISEILFIHQAIKHDFCVFRHFLDQSEVDYIITKDCRTLFRIQVKTAHLVFHPQAVIALDCRSHHKKRPPDLTIVDYFCFYYPDKDIFFNLPVFCIPPCGRISVGVHTSSYTIYQDNWDFVK